jgi:SSS family solute:Na+ symporter
MSIVFVILVFLMIVITLQDPRNKNKPALIKVDRRDYRCSPSFIAGSVIIIGILTALYTVFW